MGDGSSVVGLQPSSNPSPVVASRQSMVRPRTAIWGLDQNKTPEQLLQNPSLRRHFRLLEQMNPKSEEFKKELRDPRIKELYVYYRKSCKNGNLKPLSPRGLRWVAINSDVYVEVNSNTARELDLAKAKITKARADFDPKYTDLKKVTKQIKEIKATGVEPSNHLINKEKILTQSTEQARAETLRVYAGIISNSSNIYMFARDQIKDRQIQVIDSTFPTMQVSKEVERDLGSTIEALYSIVHEEERFGAWSILLKPKTNNPRLYNVEAELRREYIRRSCSSVESLDKACQPKAFEEVQNKFRPFVKALLAKNPKAVQTLRHAKKQGENEFLEFLRREAKKITIEGAGAQAQPVSPRVVPAVRTLQHSMLATPSRREKRQE